MQRAGVGRGVGLAGGGNWVGSDTMKLLLGGGARWYTVVGMLNGGGKKKSEAQQASRGGARGKEDFRVQQSSAHIRTAYTPKRRWGPERLSRGTAQRSRCGRMKECSGALHRRRQTEPRAWRAHGGL
jgi:hypothetical protein